MGATRLPVVTNPGFDPGRNQPREEATDSPDVRGGNYTDAQSMVHNPGGGATCRKTWFGEGYLPDGDANEQVEMRTRNGNAPRDRGNRTV